MTLEPYKVVLRENRHRGSRRERATRGDAAGKDLVSLSPKRGPRVLTTGGWGQIYELRHSLLESRAD